MNDNSENLDDFTARLFDPPKFIMNEVIDLALLLNRLVIYTHALKARLEFPHYTEVNNWVMGELKRKCRSLDGLNPDEIEQLLNEGIDQTGVLSDKDTRELLRRACETIKNINPYDSKASELLIDACRCLSASAVEYDEFSKDEKQQFIHSNHALNMKAHEAIGYWTAKLEIKKKNKNNVGTRTKTKESRKAELQEWMKTMKPKEYRLKAQEKWNVSERTVWNYEQEMKDEKTSILRKNDDIT